MGTIVRAITSDGSVVAFGIDSKDIVNKACDIHKPTATVAAALGRLISATSLMGIMLKGRDDSVTVRFDGGGPAGTLIAVSDSRGNVRAFVSNPLADKPLNEYHKLDVAGVVGTTGTLSVIKDLNLKEPYSGQIPIVSGEIAEDITHYFAKSEQIPTICALGVLVDRDLTIKASGGFIVQLLPFADPSAIDQLEKNLKKVESVTSILDKGATVEEMVRMILDGFEVEILDTNTVEYVCNCSRDRVSRALKSLGSKEINDIIAEQGGAEVTCHFCGKAYQFSKMDLEKLIKIDTNEN